MLKKSEIEKIGAGAKKSLCRHNLHSSMKLAFLGFLTIPV